MAFTYTGPSVAAAFVTGVYNEAWDLAFQKSADALSMSQDAVDRASTPSLIVSTPQAALPEIPSTPSLTEPMSIAEATGLYTSTVNEIKALLTDNFTAFISEYFGNTDAFTAAGDWLNKAISEGGTGLTPAAEQRIYDRDRDRVLAEARRTERQALTGFSAKRYRLPPGSMMASIANIRREAGDRLGDNSRQLAIQAMTMEIENVRFAVERAITLRTQALQSAGEYIRVLALGPQTGAAITTAMLDVQAKAAQTLSSFYTAQVAAAELPLRARLSNAELVQRTSEANQRASVDAMNQRVQATMAAAQSLGTQAAAALNGLTAQTQFSGNESL